MVSKLRERNVERRRQRILAAAHEIVVSQGVAGLTMRKLADRANLAVKTLYNLYGSRRAIVRALIVQAMDAMDKALEEEAPLEDPLARCRAVVTVTIRHLAGDEAMFRAMTIARFQESVVDETPAESDIDQRAAQMQAVAIRSAVARGLLRDRLDPDCLGSQIYRGYQMAQIQWAFGEIDENGFRVRALYALYIALLAVASDAVRPAIETELAKLERKLKAQRSAARRTRKSRRTTTGDRSPKRSSAGRRT